MRRSVDDTDTDTDAASHARTVQSSYSSYTRDGATIVNVDLPGVAEDQVTVELHGRKLTITGRRATSPAPEPTAAPHTGSGPAAVEPTTVVTDEKDEKNDKSEKEGHDDAMQHNPMQVEANGNDNTRPAEADRSPQVVYRTVLSLRPTIDVDAVEVQNMQHGVLTLRLPHRKRPEPRRLTVQ